MMANDVDETTGVETTGHEWDGIKELDNPMPRWWLWTFYATIIFSLGYVIYYPAIPLLEGSTMGISGQTNRLQLKQELSATQSMRSSTIAKLKDLDLETIHKDQDLIRFATAGGKSLFKVYCTQCHGSGAQGGPGYPNLNDDDWLWGGDLNEIYTSIAHGVRNEEDDDARYSEMPAFGSDGILDQQQIDAVTEYVLSISDGEYNESQVEAGKEMFLEHCASCHGEDGKGDRELGAPNLTDALSLYGNTRSTIRAQIRKPLQGAMPSWLSRLGVASVKQLTIYVHGLGGGEETIAD